MALKPWVQSSEPFRCDSILASEYQVKTHAAREAHSGNVALLGSDKDFRPVLEIVKGADRKLIFRVLHILCVMQDLLLRTANQVAANQVEHLILVTSASSIGELFHGWCNPNLENR